jgi:inner membrane protein
MLLAHAPAGYLLTRFLSRTVFKNSINPERTERLYQIVIAAGLLGSILPDFDFIYHIFIDSDRTPHHMYITHTPVFWMILLSISIICGKLFKKPDFVIITVTGCAAAILHLVCDTLTGEIYWLYPLSNRGFNLFSVSDIHIWWVQNYISHWTFLVEIAICTIAMVVFLRIKETINDLLHVVKHSTRLRSILVRISVCITGVILVILVGSQRFDIDNRIVKKIVFLKQRVLIATTNL